MFEPELPRPSCHRQLEELLGDPDFLRIVALTAKEVMRFWRMPCDVARGFVLSAIGEPEALASIYEAWLLGRESGEPGLAKLIVRRRVIDLLRRDAAPLAGAMVPVDAADAELAPGSFDDLVRRNPRVQLELQQVIQLVRGALACFATQGRAQHRQARLLHRYALEELDYSQLAVELVSSAGALRVRVHKAMRALRGHIRTCHPELEQLLEHGHRSLRAAASPRRATPACSAGARAGTRRDTSWSE
jgi:DNA-directed RNA polymerase specialized sigma24 family protein